MMKEMRHPSEEQRTNIHTALDTFSFKKMLSRLLPRLLINGVLPLLLYRVLAGVFSVSDVVALSLAATPPLLHTAITFCRRRRVDLLGAVVVGGFALGIVTVLLTGNARVLLLRETVFHGVAGIFCLVSLLFPRPLLFVGYTYVLAGGSSRKEAGRDALWQDQTIRSTFRRLTGVVGGVLVATTALRVFLVFFLSISTFLAIAPFLFIGSDVLLAIWIVHVLHATQRRVQALWTTASATMV